MPAELAAVRRKVALSIAIRFPMLCLFFGGILFVPAGRFYREGVFYCATILAAVLPLLAWLLIRDPELLERRLRTKEREPTQKWIVVGGLIYALLAFSVPGLDHRFGWSSVPMVVAIASDLMIIAGYLLFFIVIRANRWASRVIEVEPGQQVVSTGPYAVVRHPMYVAAIVIYIFSGPALGSWWACLALLPLVFVLLWRIRNEEEVLARDLPGYREYLGMVRYRLIPHVW